MTTKAEQTLTPETVTLEMCQQSDFGCLNCLWRGIECKSKGKFKPAVTHDGKAATCTAYVYCD